MEFSPSRCARRAAAHAVQVGADVADELAVLGDAAEQERVDLVEPRRDDRGVLLRARVLHLREQRLGDAERLERALQALPQRRIESRVDATAFVSQYLDRVHHADAARQVGPQEPEHRLVQTALRGAEGGVERAVHDLRRRAAPVDGQLVTLDGDRARVLEQHVLTQRRVGEEVDPVGAVRQLADPPPRLGLDVLQGLAQRDDERVPADLVDQREQPLLDPQRGVQLHLQVLVLQLRLAHRILQEGEQVAPDLTLLDDLERAHPDPVVVGRLELDGMPPGSLAPFSPSWMIVATHAMSSPSWKTGRIMLWSVLWMLP